MTVNFSMRHFMLKWHLRFIFALLSSVHFQGSVSWGKFGCQGRLFSFYTVFAGRTITEPILGSATESQLGLFDRVPSGAAPLSSSRHCLETIRHSWPPLGWAIFSWTNQSVEHRSLVPLLACLLLACGIRLIPLYWPVTELVYQGLQSIAFNLPILSHSL